MKHPSLSDRIRQFAALEYLEPARRRGDLTVSIVAGDVHRTLKLANRVPAVCAALRSKRLLEDNGVVLERSDGPPSGQGTRMTYTYRVLNPAQGTQRKESPSPFRRLQGIAKDVFQTLGGAETFLLSERSKFYESGRKTQE